MTVEELEAVFLRAAVQIGIAQRAVADCGHSRELSLTLTKLQEATHWLMDARAIFVDVRRANDEPELPMPPPLGPK